MLRGRVKNYLHYSFYNLFTQKVGVQHVHQFFTWSPPLLMHWSSSPQACVFLPRGRFSICFEVTFAPLSAHLKSVENRWPCKTSWTVQTDESQKEQDLGCMEDVPVLKNSSWWFEHCGELCVGEHCYVTTILSSKIYLIVSCELLASACFDSSYWL